MNQRDPLTIAIIGGGISGLAAAYRLEALARTGSRPWSVTLFEASSALGGKVRTERVGGLLLEEGPDAILLRKPWGRELAASLGLVGHIVYPTAAARKTYLARDGELRAMPPGTYLGIPTRAETWRDHPLLSSTAGGRAAQESLVPQAKVRRDESLADFLGRRFGREAAAYVIAPLLAGIYGGRAQDISVEASFPQLKDWEHDLGSVTAGVREALAKATGDGDGGGSRPGNGGAGGRAGGPDPVPGGGPGPVPGGGSGPVPGRGSDHGAGGGPPPIFFSLRNGLGSLIKALVQHLEATDIVTSMPVTAIAPAAGDKWHLRLGDGKTHRFDKVILAAPAHAAAPILRAALAPVAEALATIRYAPTTVVTFAFPAGQVGRALDGGGFLIPEPEQNVISGCTWSSSKWPHVAPPATAVLRCFISPTLAMEAGAWSETELLAAVQADLEHYHGPLGQPSLARVYRWPRAMPRYQVGHLDRLAALDGLVADLPGLVLAGAAYRGIGIPDCIGQGQAAADRLLN